MDLKHSFTVPATIDETWAAFNDIESVAGCFPGAVVTSVEGDSFEGNCKVKLGPIALVYKGTGTFIEKDEASHTMKIDAKGKDKRGNGTAGAKVTATMREDGDSTTVEVVTDLNVTGKPAQFGRGVMQDVSDKLLGQFVDCLQTKVGDPSGSGDTTEPSGAAAPAGAPTDTVSSGPSDSGPTPDPSAPAAAGSDGAATAASATPAKPVAASSGQSTAQSAPGQSSMPSSAQSSSAQSSSAQSSSAQSSASRTGQASGKDDDALDLGATVIPILLKAYWKPVGAVLAVVLVIIVLIKRL